MLKKPKEEARNLSWRENVLLGTKNAKMQIYFISAKTDFYAALYSTDYDLSLLLNAQLL